MTRILTTSAILANTPVSAKLLLLTIILLKSGYLSGSEEMDTRISFGIDQSLTLPVGEPKPNEDGAKAHISLGSSGSTTPGDPPLEERDVSTLKKEVRSAFNSLPRSGFGKCCVSASDATVADCLRRQAPTINLIVRRLSEQFARETDSAQAGDYIHSAKKGLIDQPLTKSLTRHIHATTGKMGAALTIQGELLQHPFYKELFSLSGQTILDVGAGYGETCLRMLGKNNTLICNEPEISQLFSILDQARVSEEGTTGLFLNNSYFQKVF